MELGRQRKIGSTFAGFSQKPIFEIEGEGNGKEAQQDQDGQIYSAREIIE